jgi:hypothetical protein
MRRKATGGEERPLDEKKGLWRRRKASGEEMLLEEKKGF